MKVFANSRLQEAEEREIFPPPPPSSTQRGRDPPDARDARDARLSPLRPSPEGEKLAATNERPRRGLTSEGRRAALPGDPGRSAFSPLPECALPRRRAALGLYIGRALAGLGVPPVRELPTARAGGRPRRRAALSLLLCPPLRGLLLGPQANFPSLPAPRPLIRLGSSRAAPRAPPNLPACSSDHHRTQKNVDHTSVSLLRYRLLVQGKPAAGKDGGRPGILWSSKTWPPGRAKAGGTLPS